MRANPRPHGHRRRLLGGSLIEVLVSVLVLTFGLMGAAALQVRALRNNQSSYEHAQMTVLVHSMFDAMRANVTGVDAGAYEMADWTCAAPTATSLAGRDRADWITNLQAQIQPGACGRISCTARDCRVGIRWDDARATGGSATQTFELRARL